MVAITWHDTSALIYHTLQPSDGHAPLPPPSPWKPPRSSGLLLHHFANLPPTMRLQYLRLWSLNFPPVSPVHITPTSKACLLGASLTPALSVPGPQLIPHLGPLLLSIQALRFDPSVKVAWVPPANAHFFFLHQPIYHDYILYCSWPCVLFAHLDVSVLTMEPHFLLLCCLPCPKPKHLAPCWARVAQSLKTKLAEPFYQWPLPHGLPPQSHPRPRSK